MKNPHVVAVPLPGQGHLNSLMRFCRVLAAQGVLVTFVNIDPVHHRIEEVSQCQPNGLQENGNGGAAERIKRVHIPIHGLELVNDFRMSIEPMFEAQSSIAPYLELLILQLNRQGPPVTCIVSDFAMTSPTQSVADRLNIPRIVLFTSSASALLLFYYVIQGERTSTTRVLEALAQRTDKREVICDGLPGLPDIHNNELPTFKHMADDNTYMWECNIRKGCEESLRKAHAVVINSFEELEAPAFMALSKHLSLPVYGVGPLVQPLSKESSTSLWQEDEACLLWLDQQPPLSVLYISFGSIALLSERQFEEILVGLLCSRQRFLWAFRPDLVENVERSSTLAADILSRSHGKGHVVDWAPQLDVLSHPSVGGFLTHCGWNSTVEAIAHGVPMLCWPYFADQFLDAKYIVEEWKVGLQFEASKEDIAIELVERGEVERVIRALMEGDEGRALRKNVMRLKEGGSRSLLEAGGSSHRNIQALIRSLILQSTG